MPHHRVTPLLLSLLVVFSLAGCGHQRAAMSSAEVAGMGTTESVRQVGISVRGRPIVVHTFNAGPNPVLVFAAIHGDERTTAYVAEQLLVLLRSEPSVVEGTPVAIVPVANPDGYAADTRVNANKVDLNRNFPATNWKSAGLGTKNYNGPSPASEPETRVLMKLIEELRPRRVCSIHSIGQGRQQDNYDGPAKGLADVMAKHNGYPASPNIGYPTPGSFGSWAGIDRQLPVITLELPSRQPGPEAWEANREAVLAFIRGR
jgi:protein MpaA